MYALTCMPLYVCPYVCTLMCVPLYVCAGATPMALTNKRRSIPPLSIPHVGHPAVVALSCSSLTLFTRALPQVLAELPGQLLGYMGTHNIVPPAWEGTPYQLPHGNWYGEHMIHKPAVVKKRR